MSERVWAYCADLHVHNHGTFGGETVAGINARGRICLQVVSEALQAAAGAGCTDFCVAGDVLHTCSPAPQLVTSLGQLFAQHAPMFVHLTKGNHDMFSEAPGDHALGPLGLAPNVRVYDGPAIVGDHLLLPFRKAPVAQWLEQELEHGAKRGARVAVAHFGMIASSTPPFLRDAPDAAPSEWLHELLIKHRYRNLVLGNWHNRASYGRVVQLGTLCPHAFGESAGTLRIGASKSAPPEGVVLDGAPEFVEVPFGDDVDSMMPFSSNGARRYFVRVIDVPRAKADDAKELLRRWREECPNILGAEIDVVAGDSARMGGVLVGLSTASRADMVEAWVSGQFKAEPAEVRAEVLARVRGYGVGVR